MSIGDVHHHRGCPRVVVLTPAQTSIDAYTLSETHIVGTAAAIAFYVGVLDQLERTVIGPVFRPLLYILSCGEAVVKGYC